MESIFSPKPHAVPELYGVTTQKSVLFNCYCFVFVVNLCCHHRKHCLSVKGLNANSLDCKTFKVRLEGKPSLQMTRK
jgi:hypothetical protein